MFHQYDIADSNDLHDAMKRVSEYVKSKSEGAAAD